MKKFVKTNRASLFLLGGLVIGGILGVILGERANFFEPFGQIFINLMYMVIVPLVFFGISSAIAQMSSGERIGKIMLSTLIIFTFTAIMAGVLGYIGLITFPIIDTSTIDTSAIINEVGTVDTNGSLSIVDRLVNMLTVNDFYLLFSKDNMIAIIIMSILVGLATSKTKQQNDAFKNFLVSGNQMMMSLISHIMVFAPIGLGCYFAAIIGNLGSQFISGYMRIVILYCILTLIYFFVFMTWYAYLAGGKTKVKLFWGNILPPAITALATCSSAASIPVNIEYTKKMQVPDDIAETVIPLGANVHKDGSVIGGVFKIGFLFLLYGRDIGGIQNILLIIGGGVFVGLVMGSIPGGGMIAETVIVSMYGFPLDAIPLILIISTIIDMPATLLNSSGNTVSAMMVQRLVGVFDCKEGS